MAALSILVLHLAIITFNAIGCIAIPLGARQRWRWVREFWWRLAHLLGLAVVALQALLGRACVLAIWQADAAGTAHVQPLIATWIDRMIYWPLPLWVFAVLYVALFAYVVALWIFVQPRLPWARQAR